MERILGSQWREFQHWFYGQTGSICEGKQYDYTAKQHFDTGCGPHGPVVYSHDLKQFLRRGEPFD